MMRSWESVRPGLEAWRRSPTVTWTAADDGHEGLRVGEGSGFLVDDLVTAPTAGVSMIFRTFAMTAGWLVRRSAVAPGEAG